MKHVHEPNVHPVVCCARAHPGPSCCIGEGKLKMHRKLPEVARADEVKRLRLTVAVAEANADVRKAVGRMTVNEDFYH